MALTLATTCRNAIVDAVDTLLSTAATLEFATSGDAEVATLTLQNPAFDAGGTGGAGVITLQGVTLSDTDATGGDMAKFFLKTGGSTTQITGTVALSGGDINFPGGLTVGVGDTVSLTAFTITCPAS